MTDERQVSHETTGRPAFRLYDTTLYYSIYCTVLYVHYNSYSGATCTSKYNLLKLTFYGLYFIISYSIYLQRQTNSPEQQPPEAVTALVFVVEEHQRGPQSA